MRLFFLGWLLALAGPAFSQAALQPLTRPKIVLSPSVFFRQRIDVRPYAGKPYRLEARMRVRAAGDSAADANVLISLADKNKKYLGGTSFGKMRARAADSTWRTYTYAGKLPATVASLGILANSYLNGTFDYDDFRLQIEASKGRWQDVPLVNGNFNLARTDSASGFPNGWQQPYQVAEFSHRLVETEPGNRYLEIRGRGVVNYGKNARAGHTVAVNGIKLYYETYGSGPPLLLLHGNGGSIREVANQIPALARHFQVIAVDTRAQGQSGDDGRPLSYDLFADDMGALLTALKLPAADVVGWSDGGNTGLSLALRYPRQVRKLVTMGANLYADTTAISGKLLKQVRHDKKLLTLVSPLKKQFRTSRRLVNLLLQYPQMRPEQLQKITAPTLVLAGEKDVIKEAHTRLIAASIPGAQLTIFPGLSHYAPQENPALFNDTVLRFLLGPAYPPAPAAPAK